MRRFFFHILYVFIAVQVFGQSLTSECFKEYARVDGDMNYVDVNYTVNVNQPNHSDSSETNFISTKSADFSAELIKSSNNTKNEFSLAVMGSSVPWGVGADPGKGYAQLFAQYLAENSVNTWSTVNISVPGNNTTDVLNRWDNDFLKSCSKYVYYGLSLGNEGIHEKGQPAFDSYRDNMLLLIEKSRAMNKIPLMGNNYPRGDFNATDYNYVKQLNLLIHEWDVPSVNLLGAIDNGSGSWVTAYEADNAHPNTIGHAEMYYAIVPSLMDALASGKPQPVRDRNSSLIFNNRKKAKRISWVPEGITHSFTITFSFKTKHVGTLASFQNENHSFSLLRIGKNGKLIYETTSGLDKLKSGNAVNDGQWHTVSLTHYYAWGRTFLYMDGIQATNTTVIEKLVPEKFFINDHNESLKRLEVREIFFHRSGMNSDEIAALHSGRMLKSSLEIYAPLNGLAETEQKVLENKAQSLNLLKIEFRN